MPLTGGHVGGRVARTAVAPIAKRVVPFIVPIVTRFGGGKSVYNKTTTNIQNTNVSNTRSNTGILTLNFDFSRKVTKPTTTNFSPSFDTSFNYSFKQAISSSVTNAAVNLAAYNVKNIVTGNIQTHSDIYTMYHSNKTRSEDTTNKMSNSKQSGANLGRSIHDVNTKLNVKHKQGAFSYGL